MEFFICEHCKNLIYFVKNTGVPVVCCGEKMKKLEAGTVDASHEKHLPLVKQQGNSAEVQVGSVEHPMMQEHFIQMIAIETNKGCQIRTLSSADEPKAVFALAADEKLIATYEYCNIHGLWKA